MPNSLQVTFLELCVQPYSQDLPLAIHHQVGRAIQQVSENVNGVIGLGEPLAKNLSHNVFCPERD
jgi:hypothetical protein